jgi:hypothetical protein
MLPFLERDHKEPSTFVYVCYDFRFFSEYICHFCIFFRKQFSKLMPAKIRKLNFSFQPSLHAVQFQFFRSWICICESPYLYSTYAIISSKTNIRRIAVIHELKLVRKKLWYQEFFFPFLHIFCLNEMNCRLRFLLSNAFVVLGKEKWYTPHGPLCP